MKCYWRWEVTNKYIYNVYILCSKTVDDFSIRGIYVRILGYVVGILYICLYEDCLASERPYFILLRTPCCLHGLHDLKAQGVYDFYVPGLLERESIFYTTYSTIIKA